MVKYLTILPLVALIGCSKSLPVDTSVFEAANVGCKAYDSKVKSVYGKFWFPTFKEEVVVVCSKPDKSQDLVLSLSFKGEIMTTQQEIDSLYSRLEELDHQAFLNFVETQEIVQRIRELGREVPENKMKGEM